MNRRSPTRATCETRSDAVTTVEFPEAGAYRVWVRTKDWVAAWDAPGAPGGFQLLVSGTALDVTLPANAGLRTEHRPDMLGGVTVLRGEGRRGGEAFELLAVPYFAWANRGPGEMAVWLPMLGETR